MGLTEEAFGELEAQDGLEYVYEEIPDGSPGESVLDTGEMGAVCQMGHLLEESTAGSRRACDLCGASLEAGSALWRCGECNFDTCGACAAQSAAAGGMSVGEEEHPGDCDDAMSEGREDIDRCESGHPLLQDTCGVGGGACDICSGALAEAETLWRCGLCNYDICRSCSVQDVLEADALKPINGAVSRMPSDEPAGMDDVAFNLAEVADENLVELRSISGDVLEEHQREGDEGVTNYLDLLPSPSPSLEEVDDDGDLSEGGDADNRSADSGPEVPDNYAELLADLDIHLDLQGSPLADHMLEDVEKMQLELEHADQLGDEAEVGAEEEMMDLDSIFAPCALCPSDEAMTILMSDELPLPPPSHPLPTAPGKGYPLGFHRASQPPLLQQEFPAGQWRPLPGMNGLNGEPHPDLVANGAAQIVSQIVVAADALAAVSAPVRTAAEKEALRLASAAASFTEKALATLMEENDGKTRQLEEKSCLANQRLEAMCEASRCLVESVTAKELEVAIVFAREIAAASAGVHAADAVAGPTPRVAARRDICCNHCKMLGHNAKDCPNIEQGDASDADELLPDVYPLLSRYVAEKACDFSASKRRKLWKAVPGEESFCSTCGIEGHHWETCPEKRCFICLVRGHLEADCPQRLQFCQFCNLYGHLREECALERSQEDVPLEHVRCIFCGNAGHAQCGATPFWRPLSFQVAKRAKKVQESKASAKWGGSSAAPPRSVAMVIEDDAPRDTKKPAAQPKGPSSKIGKAAAPKQAPPKASARKRFVIDAPFLRSPPAEAAKTTVLEPPRSKAGAPRTKAKAAPVSPVAKNGSSAASPDNDSCAEGRNCDVGPSSEGVAAPPSSAEDIPASPTATAAEQVSSSPSEGEKEIDAAAPRPKGPPPPAAKGSLASAAAPTAKNAPAAKPSAKHASKAAPAKAPPVGPDEFVIGLKAGALSSAPSGLLSDLRADLGLIAGSSGAQVIADTEFDRLVVRGTAAERTAAEEDVKQLADFYFGGKK